jgi:tryptophan-rich sensory protein
MKIKLNYLVIPLIVFAVAVIGTLATTPNLETWYKTLTLPSFAPAGQIIGTVWTILYILISISLIIFWNKAKRDDSFKQILLVFGVNGFLNAFWSYVFFAWHQIGWAVLISALMAITIYLLIYQLYSKSLKTAAYLLVPYAAWVTFATYLNYVIFTLNK